MCDAYRLQQGEVRTGGGGVPLAALRATSLRCDVRRDSLAAASVGPPYKLNPVDPYSLKPPGFVKP
jgi:hypothetical protein